MGEEMDRVEGCSAIVRAWAARGRLLRLNRKQVFVVDVPSADSSSTREPLLILHGFPTSSFDFAGIVDALAADRRVVLADFLGFGISDKPDTHYTIDMQADMIVALTHELGLDRLALLTHDMGDTIGGELLARHAEGEWAVQITRRILTNGSIYINQAHLTDGQQFLLDLPDAAFANGPGPAPEAIAATLLATLSRNTYLTTELLHPHGELVSLRDGGRMLPRTIRYIEERRRNERRFTGAIEDHVSPLAVIWGVDDPIAGTSMCDTLAAARSDTSFTMLDRVGHYPMLEDTVRFVEAVRTILQ